MKITLCSKCLNSVKLSQWVAGCLQIHFFSLFNEADLEMG